VTGAILAAAHQPAHMTRLGLDVAAAGVAFGLVALVLFAIGGTRRSRSRAGRADHRRGAPRPEPSAAFRGHSRSSGHGKDQGRPGTQQPGTQRPGAAPADGRSGRDGAARSGRPPLLNPTNVYSPGGLIGPPGESRTPGTPDGQDIPEILRTAGPGPAPGGPVPGAHAGGRGPERPPPGWARPQPPRPGYPPGMSPGGGPGRMPPRPGGQPAPSMPPHADRK